MAIFVVIKPTPATIATLELDAMLTATHSGEVDVTDHPVEQGANPVDHKREKPETVTIEGVVSSIPVSQAAREQFDVRADRAASAYDQLLAIKAGSDLVEIVTPLRSYTSMVMTSLSVPEATNLGGAVRFTATFKQVRVVTSQTVQVPTKINSAQSKVKGGKKTAPPADAATQKKALDAQAWDFLAAQKSFDPFKLLSGGGS